MKTHKDYYQIAINNLKYKEITCWSRLVNGVWTHNHIENGHSKLKTPSGNKEQNKAWKGAKWLRGYCYLDKNNVVI